MTQDKVRCVKITQGGWPWKVSPEGDFHVYSGGQLIAIIEGADIRQWKYLADKSTEQVIRLAEEK